MGFTMQISNVFLTVCVNCEKTVEKYIKNKVPIFSISTSFVVVVALLLCLWSRKATLLDASLLTGKLTEVVDTSTANNTILVNLDLVDVW